MSLEDLVEELVEERSLDALERLTGSRNDEVLEALVGAAGRLLHAETTEDTDDGIVEAIRAHLVECRAIGVLVDALGSQDGVVRELALACLGEIGDPAPIPHMIALLEHKDSGTREAAAAHLALLTSYDFGQDPAPWRAWWDRKVKGLEDQALEDREDGARLLKLKMRGKRGEDQGYPDEGGGGDDEDDYD